MRVAMDIRGCLLQDPALEDYAAELGPRLRELGADLSYWFAALRGSAPAARLGPRMQAALRQVPLTTTRLPNSLLYDRGAVHFWRNWPKSLPLPPLLPARTQLYHATWWPLPPVRRIPLILTVRSLLGLRQPSWTPPEQLQAAQAVRDFAPRAAFILATSDASRDEVLETCDVDPARVLTVRPGVSAAYALPTDDQAVERVRRELDLPRPYFICLANQEPRHNLRRLIRAYDLFLEDTGLEVDLLLIGIKLGYPTTLEDLEARSRRGRLRLLPDQPLETQQALLAGALGSACVALGEGYGLPALQAMAAGCPVLYGQTGAWPEVVGEAGVPVDPLDVEGLVEGLSRLTDETTRRELSASGLARLDRFNWDESAAQVHAVYERAVQR